MPDTSGHLPSTVDVNSQRSFEYRMVKLHSVISIVCGSSPIRSISATASDGMQNSTGEWQPIQYSTMQTLLVANALFPRNSTPRLQGRLASSEMKGSTARKAGRMGASAVRVVPPILISGNGLGSHGIVALKEPDLTEIFPEGSWVIWT